MDIYRLNDLAKCDTILADAKPKLTYLGCTRNKIMLERWKCLDERVSYAAKHNQEPPPLLAIRKFAALVDEALGPTLLEEYERNKRKVPQQQGYSTRV